MLPGLLADLDAESADLDARVAPLDARDWARPTPAPGWTRRTPDRPPGLDRPGRAARRHRRGGVLRGGGGQLGDDPEHLRRPRRRRVPRPAGRAARRWRAGRAALANALGDVPAGPEAAVVRHPHVADVDGDRADHGDLGARPGRGRRARRRPAPRPTACGTWRTSASVPSGTRSCACGRPAPTEPVRVELVAPDGDTLDVRSGRRRQPGHRPGARLLPPGHPAPPPRRPGPAGHRPGGRRVARPRPGVRRPARRRAAHPRRPCHDADPDRQRLRLLRRPVHRLAGDARRRRARRAHRRLPRRADHADPRPRPPARPGPGLREDVPAPDERHCLGHRPRPGREDRDQRRRAQPGRAWPPPSALAGGSACRRIGYVEGDALRRPDALTANAYLGRVRHRRLPRRRSGRRGDRAGHRRLAGGRPGRRRTSAGDATTSTRWPAPPSPGTSSSAGRRSTGGNFSFFTELPDGGRRPGFPIAEVHADGSAVITKHPGTGGAVTVETVTAQLLYEIGAPAYLGPDVVTHLDTVTLGAGRARPGPGHRHPGQPAAAHAQGRRQQPRRLPQRDDVRALRARHRGQGGAGQGAADRGGRQGRAGVHAGPHRPPGRRRHRGGQRAAARTPEDSDQKRAGRAFSAAAVELALASYPGLTLTTAARRRDPVRRLHRRHRRAGRGRAHRRPPGWRARHDPPTARIHRRSWTLARRATTGKAADIQSEDRRRDRAGRSGEVVGARSGDKGGDANLGVWARTDAGTRGGCATG